MRSGFVSRVFLVAILTAIPAAAQTIRYTASSGAKSNAITLHSRTGEAYLLRLDRYHGIDDQVILLELVLTRPGREENLLASHVDFIAADLSKFDSNARTRDIELPELGLKVHIKVQSFHTTGDCKAQTGDDCLLRDLQLRVTTR